MKEKCTSTTTALIYAHSFFLKKNSTFYINLSPHLRGQRKTLTCPLTSPTRPKKASSSPLAFSGEPRLPRLPPPARPHPIFLPPISLSLARPLESSTDRIPRGSSAAILRRRRAQASGQDRIASCLYLASVSFLFIYLFFSFAFLLSMGRAWNRSRSLFFFVFDRLSGTKKASDFSTSSLPPISGLNRHWGTSRRWVGCCCLPLESSLRFASGRRRILARVVRRRHRLFLSPTSAPFLFPCVLIVLQY